MYYNRKPTRLPNYDYSTENYYFITICTHNKKCFFGLTGQLSKAGMIADEHINQIAAHYEQIRVDKYVIMPNHVHMILVIEKDHCANAQQVIAQYKSGVSREIRKDFPGLRVWQRSFHDHVIRDQRGYEKIWLYIEGNPQNWSKDCFYTEFTDVII